MPIAFFDVDTQKRSVSAAGAPPIVFRFTGDTCEAELEGISLVAKLGPDGSIAVLVHTYQHEVFASFDLRPSQTMEPARSLMEVGSALIWSNWRRKHAHDAASARAEEEKLGAPDGWGSVFATQCVDAGVDKLRELIADYLDMEGNSVGGSFHIVLDDGNHDRSSVAFCLRNAVERRDWDGVALGTAILALDDIEYDKLLPPWDDEESHPDPLPGPALQPADLLAALDWLLLTKRPENLERMLPWGPAFGPHGWAQPWPNVWIGTSMEDDHPDRHARVGHLIQVPAVLRFLSMEPLLEAVSVERWLWLGGPSTAGPWTDALGRRRRDHGGGGAGGMTMSSRRAGDIGWIIAGCESGAGKRLIYADAFRLLRDECSAAGVPAFGPAEADSKTRLTVIGSGAGTKAKRDGVLAAPYLDRVQHLEIPTPLRS